MANFIGVSGIAGAGKDLFCNLVQSYFEGIRKVHVKSIAFALKSDVKETCLELYGIDSVNATRQEKNRIRDYLVFYGDIMRKKTKGKYWVDKLDEECYSMEREGKLKDNDIVIISDVRYDEYDQDETFWIRNHNNGVLVHIKKHFVVENGPSCEKVYGVPPNDKEKINDPKVQEKADYLIDWPNIEGSQGEVNDSLCSSYVKNFCDWYESQLK